jgi:metacaspase-1
VAKIALCVGLNQYDPSIPGMRPLRGCINDAVLLGEMLRVAGFEVRQVHDQAATQQGISDRLSVEIAKLREGDYFVFSNSSHGTQVRDRTGDELLDFTDEAICTYDHDDRDAFTDDKLGRIISRADPDATCVIISDSCHSGTLTRELTRNLVAAEEKRPLTPQEDGSVARLRIPPPDLVFRTGEPLINLDEYVEGMGNRQEKPAEREVRRFGKLSRRTPEEEIRHLLLAGCKPEQVSWDADFSSVGRAHGAMTYNFTTAVLNAWKDGKAITYREAHEAACKGVRERFDQDPQLEGPDRLKDEPVFGYVPQ